MSFERDLWESCAESAREQCALLERQIVQAYQGFNAAVCRGDERAQESYARSYERAMEFYVRLLVWLNWPPV